MQSSESSLQREPNVVPMIDIMLVLLIIFILAASMKTTKLEVQLPLPGPATVSPAPSIVLSVDPGPTYSVNGTPIAAHELQQRLASIFAGRPEKILFVKGATSVRYQDVIFGFDAARGAGVRATGVMLPR